MSKYDHNPFGKSLAIGKLYPEETVVLLEMIRGGYITSKKLTPTFKVYEPSAGGFILQFYLLTF